MIHLRYILQLNIPSSLHLSQAGVLAKQHSISTGDQISLGLKASCVNTHTLWPRQVSQKATLLVVKSEPGSSSKLQVSFWKVGFACTSLAAWSLSPTLDTPIVIKRAASVSAKGFRIQDSQLGKPVRQCACVRPALEYSVGHGRLVAWQATDVSCQLSLFRQNHFTEIADPT